MSTAQQEDFSHADVVSRQRLWRLDSLTGRAACGFGLWIVSRIGLIGRARTRYISPPPTNLDFRCGPSDILKMEIASSAWRALGD